MSRFQIVKRYGHEQGLSCVFKQFRAPETHCSKLHGYALAFEVCFEGNELDHRNWLISFGELKPLKQYLQDTFDHKTLVSANDPDLDFLMKAEGRGILDLVIVPEVGCEMFAEMVADWIQKTILLENDDALERGVELAYIKVSEHDGNSAIYYPPALQELDHDELYSEELQIIDDDMNEAVQETLERWYQAGVPKATENVTSKQTLDTMKAQVRFVDMFGSCRVLDESPLMNMGAPRG